MVLKLLSKYRFSIQTPQSNPKSNQSKLRGINCKTFTAGDVFWKGWIPKHASKDGVFLVGRPTQLIYISDIYLDDQHRSTHMNDKDHLVGQLTRVLLRIALKRGFLIERSTTNKKDNIFLFCF